jgi:glucose/mannose transport system substrate-binding protein
MKRRVSLVLTMSFLATIAIAADAPAKLDADGLALHHGWGSPSETAALDALVAVYKKRRPDATVRSLNAEGRGRMFTIVRNGQSDAFVAQAGATLLPFLDAGLVDPIDEIWAEAGLDKVIPPVLQKINSHDGHHYSIPLAVHRTNVVWYNKALLDKHRIDPATLTTWDGFFKAAETLRAAGVRAPIQMGLTWTATAVFEGIMAGLGREAYESWINGRMRSVDDPKCLAAFTTFKRYLEYVNEDNAVTGWDAALKRVISGEAAFIIMGDWAEGEFQIAGMKFGKDYGAMPVPETQGTYVVLVDAFARPRKRPHERNGDEWLKVVASREGQDAFNTLKGSIPARTDADVSRYGPYQRAAIADLKAARSLFPNHDMVEPEAFKVRQLEVIAAFALNRDVKKAAAALAAATVQSDKHFKEAWSLAQP